MCQPRGLVYLVGEAVRQEVPTEPLPPGVPYRQQQLAVLSSDRGVVALPDEELADLDCWGGGSSSGPHSTHRRWVMGD